MSVNAGEISVSVIVRTSEMTQGLSRATNTLNIFQRSASIAAGVLARDLFYAISDTTREAITLGASMDTLERSFDALASVGDDSTVSIEQLDKATMGMISRVDLLTQANRALSLGLPVEDLDKLFIGAIRLGKAMGLDATTAVEKLTLGLGRQSYRLLDDLGIVIRAGDANKIYAARIGKTVEELSAAERGTAFHTLAIEMLNEKVETLGDNIGDADKSLSQWDAAIRNTTVSIGELIAPLAGMAPILTNLTPVITGITMAAFSDLSATMGALRFMIKGLQFDLMHLASVFGLSTIAMGGVVALLAVTIPMAISGYIKLLKNLTSVKQEDTEASKRVAEAEQAVAEAYTESNHALTRYLQLLEQYNKSTEESPTLLDEWTEAQNKLAEAQISEAKALKTLNSAKEEKARIDQEYLRIAGNLVNYIKLVTGESSSYNEVLKDTVYHIDGTQDALAELEKNLGMVQMGYERATVRVNFLTNAMEKNNRVLSIQSIEQMKIRDAMQDREDVSVAQIMSVEAEIAKIEKLAQAQGFLTFAQRKELESKKLQVKELEKSGEATASETQRLAELADEQRGLEIRNAKLALQLEKATDAQDKQGKKVSEAQELINTLTSLNDTLNNVYGDQQNAVDGLSNAQDDYNEAENETKTLAEETTTAYEAYRESVDALQNAYIRTADAIKAYNDMVRERIALEEELAETEKDREKERGDAEPETPPWTPPLSPDPWMNQQPELSSPNIAGTGVGGNNINNVTNTRDERAFTNYNFNIETINSDNAEYIADALQREMERRGIK